MNSAQARMIQMGRKAQSNPKTTAGIVIIILLIIVFCVGWFAPGKIGFIKYLMKTEGHKCGNDENAVSQEFNADKECVTICNPNYEVTKDEKDKDVCTKIESVDCVVGDFGACSLVNNKCIKSRTIETEPAGDGAACPSLSEDCDQSECQEPQQQQQQQQPQQYVSVPDKRVIGATSGATFVQTASGTTEENARQMCSENPECVVYQAQCGGSSGPAGRYSLYTYPGSNWVTEVDRVKNALGNATGCVVNYKQ